MMNKASSVSNSSTQTNTAGKFFLRNATGLRREVSGFDAFIYEHLRYEYRSRCRFAFPASSRVFSTG
jgi:hypothetical protein